jgi:hypothetical protein
LDPNIRYFKEKSKASCPVKDIKAFIYGPKVSRFWVLRKHIMSMRLIDIKKNLPFYSWNCITLFLKNSK